MSKKRHTLLQCFGLLCLAALVFSFAPRLVYRHQIIKSSEQPLKRRLFPFIPRDAKYDEVHHLLGGQDYGFKDECEGGGYECRKGEQVYHAVLVDGLFIKPGTGLDSLQHQGINPDWVRTYEENSTAYWLHEGIHGRPYRISQGNQAVLEIACDTTVLRFINGNFELAYDGQRYSGVLHRWGGWTGFDSIGWEVLLKYESL